MGQANDRICGGLGLVRSLGASRSRTDKVSRASCSRFEIVSCAVSCMIV